MAKTISTGFVPNPESAVDVLAFVLCPPEVFAPAHERAAVAEVMLPIKTEAVRRWAAAAAEKRRV